jgi:diadenosine tetraphosphate (Ap4A) HIT family hydrolase
MSDSTTASCHLCAQVASGERLIYSDANFSAFALADRPGWVLYATNRHGDWIWGLSDEEANDLGPFLRTVSAALKEAADTTHIYYVGLGENSLHFHGILAARHQAFAKDIQSALAHRGKEVSDEAGAAHIASGMEERLQRG